MSGSLGDGSMLAAAAFGLCFGFVGSVPIAGPVSALVFRCGIDGRFKRGQGIAIGAAVAEAGYARAYSACHHRHPDHSILTIPRQLLWERSCTDSRAQFSEAILSCQMEWIFRGDACKRSHISGAESRPRSPAGGREEEAC